MKKRTKHRKSGSLLLFVLLLAALLVVSACRAIEEAPEDASRQAARETAGSEPKIPETTQPEPATQPATEPAVRDPEDLWRLRLVNSWNPIPEDTEITLTYLNNGEAVDERCYPELQQMMDDCRAQGLNPLICSSFRTWETQENLYQNKVQRLRNQGWPEETVYDEAARAVARPGTSEHQLGLAVDIVDIANQNLNESQEQTAVQQWLLENSWKYGFILRYPKEKSDITGVIYEPWHYRYVGKEAAEEIYNQGVCLEEYLAVAE